MKIVFWLLSILFACSVTACVAPLPGAPIDPGKLVTAMRQSAAGLRYGEEPYVAGAVCPADSASELEPKAYGDDQLLWCVNSVPRPLLRIIPDRKFFQVVETGAGLAVPSAAGIPLGSNYFALDAYRRGAVYDFLLSGSATYLRLPVEPGRKLLMAEVFLRALSGQTGIAWQSVFARMLADPACQSAVRSMPAAGMLSCLSLDIYGDQNGAVHTVIDELPYLSAKKGLYSLVAAMVQAWPARGTPPYVGISIQT